MSTIAAFLRMPFDIPPPHSNHAPAIVFIGLGAIIGFVVVALYFATGIGGEKDHWYGDGERQYHLPHRIYGPFGGFPPF